ncbi:MAG: transposase [Chloroflexi bacterium]|nr:transposase [Chloroflexota bacterium]
MRVRKWYDPVARQWLAAQFANAGEIHLIVDGTKADFAHQLLMVSMAYHKRAVPIAWMWVKHIREHGTGSKQLALLSYVRTLIPGGAIVILVRDAEFGSAKVLKQLDCWHWFYVPRQKTGMGVGLKGQSDWKPFGSFAQKAGRTAAPVDPRHTTQVCSGCGRIVEKDPHTRVHDCPHCGLNISRDLNAAINILTHGLASLDPVVIES